MQKREFFIDTPMGKLKVYAKSDKDTAENFPGVYIDLVGEDEDACLCCVEYESIEKRLQACVYGDMYSDIPTEVTPFQH